MDALRDIFTPIKDLFLTLGQTVSFWDVVDIIVIAYLIYRILGVMRRTSAGNGINGIVLILLIAWLSNLLNLKVLKFLLNQTLQMGVIVLIVLFQPELRKLFEQMGTRGGIGSVFRKRMKHEDFEAIIHSIIAASESMAKSKTGALIVFEREIGLNDYANTGTKIDAIITSELLQNIFYHNSPLHDGALLIRDGRMLAAACMLPLTNNVHISRELGMRHRAGIGISERTDAVAIIVSEQSGSISIAVDGMLKRRLSSDVFETILRNELMQKGKTKSAARKANKQKGKKR
ncbi:MAG: diadenylate cyclase CdaA [Oscillospiraceae bacterium]|jgi:diadenylate cyclase|nr:diadenylate cyclase CdaA [Oscillospiraceae bacterium]